ncbi:MAG: hypothetical protein ACRD97_11240 [Nitrososphaeraceae archaeon]
MNFISSFWKVDLSVVQEKVGLGDDLKRIIGVRKPKTKSNSA